jgi:ABC-type glycerol-3-phosphate transport system substrate-binding protein
MGKGSVTTYVLIGIFVVFAIVGIGAMALYRGTTAETIPPFSLTVWGPLSTTEFDYVKQSIFAEQLNLTDANATSNYTINYRQVSYQNFDDLFINELAEGRSPDLVILPQASVMKHATKLITIPFTAYPRGEFTSRYIDQARTLTTSAGIKALPLYVDPMVMYWNRTLFNNAGIAQPPVYWAEYKDSLARQLTKRDSTGAIAQSAIALGEYGNVDHSRQLLSSLILQAGNDIVRLNGGNFEAVLDSGSSATSTLAFIRDFSQPLSPYYSWNSNLPSSRQQFVSNRLATYFAPASELYELQSKNPSLLYDVAGLPQNKDGRRVTYGDLFSVAIPVQSQNVQDAYAFAGYLSNDLGIRRFTMATGLPPASRTLLAQGPINSTDQYMATFYTAALQSAGWYEPGREQVDRIFGSMVNDVMSGRVGMSQAVTAANERLQARVNNIVWQ